MLNDHRQIGPGGSASPMEAADSADRRTGQRHLSVFRVGKLISAIGQELCLIRNISSGGLMAHIYSPHDQGERVEIEFKAGRTVAGKIVWARDKKIGVQFDDEINVSDVLAPQNNDPDPDFVARAPRLDLRCKGRIRTGAHYKLIELRNISQRGASFTLTGEIQIGDEVVMLLDGLPPIDSIVRWQDESSAGITFKIAVPLEELALWASSHR